MKVHEEGEPMPLLAMQVSVVVPLAKVLPDDGSQVTVGVGHPAVVPGVEKLTTAEH
jgi:hypothetical protein